MKKTILILALIFSLLVNAFGQQRQPPAPAPSPQQSSTPDAQQDDEDMDDVVRITTKLVQVDAVVVDKDGKQVTDLKAEDFEITENGRPQPITNFSYISAEPPAAALATTAPAATAAPSPSSTAPARATAPTSVPAAPLQAGQVRRAIALVVDDLRMSGESIAATRKALRKYVDEQVLPGDLVAIIRTSAGLGALQQFTSERQQLYAAIERVRLLARSSTRIGAFTSVDTLDRLETQVTEPTMDVPGLAPESDIAGREGGGRTAGIQPSSRDADRARHESLNEFRDSLFAAGTIGALNFVVRGLKDLPGRKAVVLFSDGISIFNASSQNRSERTLAALRQLVDHASRASVVFYAIDTRGLQPTSLSAADNTSGSPQGPNGAGPSGPLSGISGIQTDRIGQQVLGPRSDELFEGQNGLNYLARETGGLALFNQNDLNKGIRRALDDLRGYYLIGYRPEDTTFDPTTGRRRFHTLTIKVKSRSDLRVRTRSGFINVAEERASERKRSRAEQLMTALLSPIPSNGVRLQLSSFFLNDASNGSTMRSVILMDARNLTFTKQPDGQHQTVLDIVTITLNEEGQVIDRVSRIETIRARPATLKRFMREGMVYGINVAINKPGAYQVRVAVRDAATGKVGSASRYIEVPSVGKEQLALSSLVISGNNPMGAALRGESANDLISSIVKAATPVSASPTAATQSGVVAGGEGMIGAEDPQAGPASRRFRHGMFLNYACVIYNAKLDKAKRPQLTTQVRLFHSGKEVFTGEVVPLDLTDQADMARPVVARRLQLGTVLVPGDYVLHLTVIDELATGSQRTSTRWIDFRID